MGSEMTKVRPLPERHNVITEFGISPNKGFCTLWKACSYWVMTVITVMAVITLITYIGGILSLPVSSAFSYKPCSEYGSYVYVMIFHSADLIFQLAGA